MTPKQELAASILASWRLIATGGGTDEVIRSVMADQDVAAVTALAKLSADPQDVARAAAVLSDGLRREATATVSRVRRRAEVEGLTPPMFRLALHDELRVQNLSALTARHLVMVAKVNGDLNQQAARQALATRLAVARANSLAAVAVRQVTRNFAAA